MAKKPSQQPPQQQRRIYMDPNQQRFYKNLLSVRTKKYTLPVKTYMTIALNEVMRQTWWAFGVPVLLLILAIIFPSAAIWLVVAAVVVTILYAGFWALQFYGMSQLDQTKMLFDRMHYEIDGRQFMAKVSKDQGMMLPWDQFKWAKKRINTSY